jgi:outer membrane protein OmpA-like peptidoglycan-associated protein/Tfp pilus assembly protein PilF
MKKHLFLSLLFLPFFLFAQPAPYSTKNKKAIAFFEAGKQFLLQRKFQEAALSFNNAIEKDEKFIEAYIALAGLYRVLRDDAKVKFYLLSAFSIQPNIPEALYEYFVLSSLFMKEGDYANASFYLDKFYSFKPTDKRILPLADKIKRNCQFAQEAMKNPLDFSPNPLPSPINQFQNQYFPSLTADNQFLLYTVRNATQMLDEENLFFSRLKNGTWETPQQISGRINTKENEGTASISGDGKTMVYTHCFPENGCDLYMTTLVGNDWTQPTNLGNKVNTSGFESQPSLSADGRTLYFASDRRGGLGAEDIWVTKLDSNNAWTPPVNLGAGINTPESDFAPFIHANNITLYFASRGRPGMGGADLFITEKKGDTVWSVPKNLGYPLNTFADESGIFVTSDFSLGYFSKDFKEKTGNYASKLYSFQLTGSLKGSTTCIYFKGRVLDAETKLPIRANIDLTDLDMKKSEQSIVSDGRSGDYLLVLPSGKNFGLFATAPGYLYKSLHFNTEDKNFSSAESFDIYLQPLRKNSSAILSNLFFETGLYTLDKTSETELKKLAKLVIDNQLNVEISGYTDNVGTASDNQLLSEKRAESVCNYLKILGVPKTKLHSKGFGANHPIGDNTTEEGRQSNRRIEIKILE